jgi:hypothetical protein
VPGDRPAPRSRSCLHQRGIEAWRVRLHHRRGLNGLAELIDIVLPRFAEYNDLEGAFGRRAVTERARRILMNGTLSTKRLPSTCSANRRLGQPEAHGHRRGSGGRPALTTEAPHGAVVRGALSRACCVGLSANLKGLAHPMNLLVRAGLAAFAGGVVTQREWSAAASTAPRNVV